MEELRMLFIGIAGGTGSGKTTVAQELVRRLGEDRVALISQDSYYKDNTHLTFEQRSQLNYDHPDAFDQKLLLNHLRDLRDGQSIEVPIYDFSTHSRIARTVTLPSKPVIVLEGIHVLADADIRNVLDIKVFVDTDPDVRVLRRIVRDLNERGRSLDSVHQQYLHTVKPMHDAFVEPSKRYADMIIPEGGENEIAIHALTSMVERYLFETTSVR
jgi:uridine kinase